MSRSHAWRLPEQHPLPDAIVAYVDSELGPVPAQRVAAHLAHCSVCAAEAGAQRQARGAVRAAPAPHVPANLLNSLRAIPGDVDLPAMPDGLAVGTNGELVAVQRPTTSSGASTAPGKAPALGSSAPLGAGPELLGEHRVNASRRAVQGAGVVVSGLVLGALTLVIPHWQATPRVPQPHPGASVPAPANAGAARAEFRGPAARPVPATTGTTVTSVPATTGTVTVPAARPLPRQVPRVPASQR